MQFQFPQIDKQQALRQLTLLGFQQSKRSEKIYLRFFYHSSHPKKASDAGRKLDGLNWKQIENYQSQGRGAYFVVNGGGHKNENVEVGRAIFFEHDDLPKDIQSSLWSTLGLPEPTFQVDTGDKSIHSYWVFDKPIILPQWTSLQKDLLEYADADRSIKNPARVMRLAGGWHISYDADGNLVTNQTRITRDSGKKYSYEELRAAIPTSEKEQNHQQLPLEPTGQESDSPQTTTSDQPQKQDIPQHLSQISIPIPEKIPLIECCRKEVREWITNGVQKGSGRNDISIEVGLELVGVENYLRSIGQIYDGSGSKLFHEYCTRSGMSQKEQEERWKWCADKNPQPSCSPDAIASCIKGWYWREHIKPNQQNSKTSSSKSKQKPKKTPIETVVKAIDEILDQNLKKSYELAALLNLSKELDNYSITELKNIAERRREEREAEDYADERKEELEQLEAWENEEYIPFPDLFYDNSQVSNAFGDLCQANQKIQPQYFLGILSVLSSLLGVNVEVSVPVLGRFRSNLFIALVGESGEGKSIVSKILLEPIYKLQQEILEQHQREKQLFEDALEHWETQHPDHRGPKPRKEDYITTTPAPLCINEYSREGIVRNHAENLNGLLIHQEELVSIQRAMNIYRQGKGDDRQFLNNSYDGGTISRVLKSERIIIAKTCISIFGGVQPDVILNEMGDLSDPDGQWARYNFITGKEKRVYTKFNQKQVDVSGLLYDLYQRAFHTQGVQCRIDPEGLEIYERYVNRLEEKRWSTIQPALRAVLSKAVGEIPRIALAIHCMNCLLKGEAISPVIPAIAIIKAIKIKNYFLRQMQILRTWGNGKGNDENGKAAAYRDLQKLARRISHQQKYLTTRIVQQARCGVLKNKKADQIRELFQELVAMGKATITKIKQSVALVIDDLLLGNSGPNDSPPPDPDRGGGGTSPSPTPSPGFTSASSASTSSTEQSPTTSTQAATIVETIVGNGNGHLAAEDQQFTTHQSQTTADSTNYFTYHQSINDVLTDPTDVLIDEIIDENPHENCENSEIQDLASLLNHVDDKEQLIILLETFGSNLITLAIAQVAPNKQNQLNAWYRSQLYTDGKFHEGQKIKYWDGTNWLEAIIEHIVNSAVLAIRFIGELRSIEVPANCVHLLT